MEITKSLLDAYAKGNVSEEERLAVRQYITKNTKGIQTIFEMMDVYHDLEDVVCTKEKNNIDTTEHADYRTFHHNLAKLAKDVKEKSRKTMFAIAADNTIDNLCDIRCEGYALRKLGIEISDEQLKNESIEREWLTDKGTRLMNIGNLCELHGAKVSRQLESNLEDISISLEKKHIVIVSVDEGELVGDVEFEKNEDLLIGRRPDHVVIIESLNEHMQEITIIDPNTPQLSDIYSLERFMDAWDDSYNFMITVSK